jgi:Glutamine amidotransferase domain
MGFILGIYQRSGSLSAEAVQPMIDALGAYEHRYLTRKTFPGCILVTANELEGESDFAPDAADGCVAAVVGTVAFHGALAGGAAETFGRAWQTDGAACLPGLDGAFAGAIYDPLAHRLWLMNDKFGMRPLLVVETADYVAFCNELEPLLRLPGYAFVLDDVAVSEYFCLGTTLGESTFAAGIRNLAPASVVEVHGAQAQSRTYWEPRIAIDRVATIEEHAVRITQVLKTVVMQLLTQLTNVRGLISAGADTRLILSCIPPDLRQQIDFLSSSLAVLPAEEDRDLIGALALVERLGLRHQILRVAFSELEFGVGYFDRLKGMRYKKILGGWHGGEFLGGFCSIAAPIRKAPVMAEVDEKLRNTFSRRFVRRLPEHPCAAYARVQAAVVAENRDFYLQIMQMGRAFFSATYYGSRGSWLQPYEIVNQGFSPFWDSRFLEAILAVPFEMVASYQLYNVIFRDCLTELTDIPSNSPLTQRADSALPRMTAGQEPKVVLQPKYQSALYAYRDDRQTWRRRLYRRWRVKPQLRDENALLTMQFTDFEAWWRQYVSN